MTKVEIFYSLLPVFSQNIAISMYGYYWRWLRFGGDYLYQVEKFREREKFSFNQWESWQKEELKRILSIAITNVPYYSKTFSIFQKKAALEGELQDLPLLEKRILSQAPYSLVRNDIKTKQFTFKTSGTTGTPVKSIWSLPENRKSLAMREVRSANWAGVSFSLPRATFSGRMVEPDPNSKGPYYRFNFAEKQVYFSAFHLRPDTAKSYVQALWSHKIEWLTGYASSYYLLATLIIKQNLKVPKLKAVITTSEKLTPQMRSIMEEAYGCRIYEEYSTVENALFASECEYGSLHVSPDAGIIEILREDGSSCNSGEVGEVVATCLLRDYQPLIRYRLGDLAAWGTELCQCGRCMPIIKEVVGRVDDIIIGPDGRQVVRFPGVFTSQPNVVEGQIIQESLDLIRIKVVPTESFNESDEIDIKKRIHQRLGESVKVVVEPVTEIPRSQAGKFKAVISNINKIII
jgi:phenylacetate-CoA ligase